MVVVAGEEQQGVQQTKINTPLERQLAVRGFL
jgi:hypothetical protein